MPEMVLRRGKEDRRERTPRRDSPERPRRLEPALRVKSHECEPLRARDGNPILIRAGTIVHVTALELQAGLPSRRWRACGQDIFAAPAGLSPALLRASCGATRYCGGN